MLPAYAVFRRSSSPGAVQDGSWCRPTCCRHSRSLNPTHRLAVIPTYSPYQFSKERDQMCPPASTAYQSFGQSSAPGTRCSRNLRCAGTLLHSPAQAIEAYRVCITGLAGCSCRSPHNSSAAACLAVSRCIRVLASAGAWLCQEQGQDGRGVNAACCQQGLPVLQQRSLLL